MSNTRRFLPVKGKKPPVPWTQNRLFSALLALGMGMGNPNIYKRKNGITVFTSPQGMARVRAKAKRKKRLHAEAVLRAAAKYLHRKTKNNRWFRKAYVQERLG